MFSVALPAAAHRGPLLIGVGLAIVIFAHLWPVVPIATAFMLIGCGATWTLLAPSRTCVGLLAWLNLGVYAILSCLAIGAQAHAAVLGPAGRVTLLLMVDHTIAAVLLVALVRTMVRRSWAA